MYLLRKPFVVRMIDFLCSCWVAIIAYTCVNTTLFPDPEASYTAALWNVLLISHASPVES